MHIQLERVQCDPDVTIGSLTADGEWVCWTCEDPVREGQIKVPGQTAIPFGKYQILVTPSPRFKRDLPLLLNVPNFEGVRIHPGNTPADTEGCILPGLDRMAKSVGRSRLAFQALFALIREAKARGEGVEIDIVKG